MREVLSRVKHSNCRGTALFAVKMPSKNDTLSLDDLDRRLLALLRQNSREPIATLAKSLGISRSGVYSRLRLLQSKGVIEAFTVRLNSNYDRHLIRAYVMMKITSKLSATTEKQLRAMPEIVLLQAISGVYDLIATVEADGPAELDQVIDRIGALDGVQKTVSSIMLATKFQR